MNIPVPPVFLYEKDFNAYEVMDGQQRITAVRDFYANSFKLSGLQMWPELNGRSYNSLPEKIKAGIDRRSITSIVLLKESTESEEDASFLRETVFDRLNTGGIKLERQEIRNALYRGKFNESLYELTRLDEFRDVWGLPRWVENEIDTSNELLNNPLFSKMGDVEIVLRFFSLRHASNYRNGMQGFMDIYMRKATTFSEADVEYLKNLYINTLTLARDIYRELIFRPYLVDSKTWDGKPHKAFQDAVMIGLSENLDSAAVLRSRRDAVISATKNLFEKHEGGTFTGRGNTKQDVLDRIGFYRNMIDEVLKNNVRSVLEQTKRRIDAIKKYAELSQTLRVAIQDQTLVHQGENSAFILKVLDKSPDRLEWRLIEHCSVVTRIYAIYEQFSQEMIREHLSLLQVRFSYSDLSDEIKATHRRGLSVILDKKDGPRYGHINLVGLVEQYGNALGGKDYFLEPAAFLMQEQNLRLPELKKLFGGCGIKEIDIWIEKHEAIVRFFSSDGRIGGNAEHEMRELIKYRNDAAHGSIELDDLPGVDYLYEFCDFISAICEAISEKVLSIGVGKLIDVKKAIVCGKVTESLKGGHVIIGKLVGDFRVGGSIILQGSGYCRTTTIKSIRINDVDHEQVTLVEATEIGIGISEPGQRRATVISLSGD